MRSVFRAALAGLSMATTAVFTPVTASAETDSLGLPTYGDMVVDQVNRRLFITGGRSANGVVVTDFSGDVKKTINNQFGADGMVLSADSRKLYVALASGDGISVIDTVSLTETARYSTGPQTCPAHLARTENILWFGYGCDESWNGGVGKLDLGVAEPKAELNKHGDARFQRAPLLTSTPDADGPVIAGQLELSLSTVYVYTVTSGNLAQRNSSGTLGSNLNDITVDNTGETMFTAAGSRQQVDATKTADLARAGAYFTGQYPNSVALSTDNTYLAGGVRNPRDDIYVYRIGGTSPERVRDITDSEVVAPRGLAWSADNRRLFVITQPPNGTRPTLHIVTSPTG